MAKELEQELKTMEFAMVVSDKKLKEAGLTKGDEVMVMSSKDVAFKKNDPYLKRTLFIVAKIEGNDVLIPASDNDYQAVVVDPRSLQLVSPERRKELFDALNKKYNG